MVIGTFSLLAVIFFTVGYMMLSRLKRYFKDFYKHFGTKLWIANVLLTFPLTFRGILDAVNLNENFNSFFIQNYYRITGYNIMIITLGTYLPMMLQIMSLIFGFVRNKQVKLFRSFAKTESTIDGDETIRSFGNNNRHSNRKR